MGATITEEQLIKINIKEHIKQYETGIEVIFDSNDLMEQYQYTLQFDPFRIIQKVNGVTTIIVNHKDTLLFEDYSKFFNDKVTIDGIQNECLAELFTKFDHDFIKT